LLQQLLEEIRNRRASGEKRPIVSVDPLRQELFPGDWPLDAQETLNKLLKALQLEHPMQAEPCEICKAVYEFDFLNLF